MRLPQVGLRPIRVLVADSTAMGCGLLSARLKKHSQFEVVGHAASAEAVLRLVRESKPEVALISATLEDKPLSGLVILYQIRRESPETRPVLMVDRSDQDLVIQALRCGARGIFCRAESDFNYLCKCVMCVHKGQIWVDSKQVEFMIDALMQSPPFRIVDSEGAKLLTKREEDVIRLVAEGLGNREIAQQLMLSEHTVRNYLFRIFNKLGISTRVELVLYALNTSDRSLSSWSDDDPVTEPEPLRARANGNVPVLVPDRR